MVTYVLADAYPSIQGASIQYGGGLTFDIEAALIAGSGSFTVDDSTDLGRQLRDALDHHPAVKRSGAASSTTVTARSVRPVVAVEPSLQGQVLQSAMPGSLPQWVDPASLPSTAGGSPYDILANRPPANTQPDRTFFYATDDNGGALYQVQNGTWVLVAPKNTELGYGQITANLPALGTSFAILLGLSVTVQGRGNPVRVKAFIPELSNAAAVANNFTVAIYKDGTQIQASIDTAPAIQFAGNPVNCDARDNPGTSQHTYAVYGKANTGGNMIPVASLTNPAYIQVTEI